MRPQGIEHHAYSFTDVKRHIYAFSQSIELIDEKLQSSPCCQTAGEKWREAALLKAGVRGLLPREKFKIRDRRRGVLVHF